MSIAREKSVFLAAIDCATDAERQAYLAEACREDSQLKAAVEALLAAHAGTRNIVDDQPEPARRLREQYDQASGASSIANQATPDRIGERIGPYRLMEMIGEGGFGRVYVAEQEKPLRRRVALKILKPWMDSREIIARFEAERQALALMDHPNIARVFDAGTTADGKPFFVMELVRGVPITEFCASQRLDVLQRLQLFIDVCEAVQHAHQRGVIHRDLKPSNVMVTLHDATPVVKVIDFGVAKAVGEPLTDKTIYTRFAQMIGTPMYMSPEQAEMNSLDVDTRSDVYALGVVLYELLTGSTPYDQQRLNTASFDELRQIIREENPPRPSVRLTTLSQQRNAIGQNVDANAATATQSAASKLRGELDWIVMKALEKDRRRRYDSAADFARDIQRYLNNEPVIARAPSQLYLFRKLAQRNKVLFTATAVVLMAMILGTAVSAWQAVRATNAYREADALRREAVAFADRLKEANVLLDSARSNAEEQRWQLAWSQYTKATELQPEHYLTWSGRGMLSAQLGAWHNAAEDFEVALGLGAPANNPGWWGVPQLCVYTGELHAYAIIRQSMARQFAETDDPASLLMAARGLLVQPVEPDEARAIAKRLEQFIDRGPPRGGPPNGIPGIGRFSFPPRWQPNPNDQRDDHRNDPRDGPRNEQRDERGGRRPDPPFQDVMRTLQLYGIGLARFRAGEHEEAIRSLQWIRNLDERMPQAEMALPVLAMAHAAQGQDAMAEQTLSLAKRARDGWTERLLSRSMQQPWFDCVEFFLLCREAEQKLLGDKTEQDSRLVQLESEMIQMLQQSK